MNTPTSSSRASGSNGAPQLPTTLSRNSGVSRHPRGNGVQRKPPHGQQLTMPRQQQQRKALSPSSQSQWINGKPTILNNISLHVETGKTDLEVFKDFAEYELDAEDNKSNDTKKIRKRFNIYRKCDGRKAVVKLDDGNGIHCTIE
ncbi:unnamed protein product [Caenorhabditis nigoni]